MFRRLPRRPPATLASALIALVLVAGCASPKHQAPVEDRAVPARDAFGGPTVPTPAAAAASAPAPALAQVEPPKPVAEAVVKPGFHQVKPGDTLIRIALENGQNWRDLVKWNNLENPNVLEVGQTLRVVPPGSDGTASARPVGSAKVESRPLDAKSPPPATSAATAPATPANAGPPAPTPPMQSAVATRDPDDDVAWQWPAAGPVAAAFEEGRTKGLVLLGKAGDPVLAAADGRVVYAGSGLRGYGNLLILKHNNTYLTAYAHNQALLVKEDQTVRRGQKIAEMGSSDAERVQLHFEIRRQGKPVDPAKLLPPR